MKLRVAKNCVVNEEVITELQKKIDGIDQQISVLQIEKGQYQEELLSVKIAPFKIGGYALAEVPSGKSKVVQKCLIECVEGDLYLRPVKDGEVSKRHFNFNHILEDVISKYLQEVN